MSYKLELKSYYNPASIKEACEILGSEENSMPIAGGTGIYIFSNKGIMSNVESFVDLEKLNLSYVKENEGSFKVGAMTKLSDIGKGITKINMIDQAILSIPREVRNVGTVGGQVFTAFPAFDLSVCLLALKGSVNITDGEETANVRISEIYSNMFNPNIEKGSIIESVEIPVSSYNRSTYLKFGYTKHGFSDVSMALVVKFKDNCLEDIGISIGGGALDSPPIRLQEVEDGLKRKHFEAELVEKGVELILKNENIKFYSDHKSSSDYRKKLLGTLFRRGITGLAEGGNYDR